MGPVAALYGGGTVEGDVSTLVEHLRDRHCGHRPRRAHSSPHRNGCRHCTAGVGVSAACTRVGADLWELWNEGRWAVIPTNTQRRRNGTAVMGGGLAADAAARFGDLEQRYGAALGAHQTRLAVRDHRLLLAPTKDHWRDPSTLALVRASATAVASYARANNCRLVVPALGCGLGGLDWADVEGLLLDTFADIDTVIIAPQ